MAVMMSAVPAVSEPVAVEARLSNAWLHVVVVRLLAVSLAITRRKSRRSDVIGRGLPKGYRAWPVFNCGAFRRFYVCPKGAGTVDDEVFPVGTVLVVETFGSCGVGGSLDAAAESLQELHSIFVLEKFASLQAFCDGHDEQGAWSYAMYDADGRFPVDGAPTSGTGRVAA